MMKIDNIPLTTQEIGVVTAITQSGVAAELKLKHAAPSESIKRATRVYLPKDWEGHRILCIKLKRKVTT